MPGILSGTLGVDSAITDTFRTSGGQGAGVFQHLRLCCPGVDFSTVPANAGYRLFTTKLSDGTLQTTCWSFALLLDSTNKNILLDLPLNPLPGQGLTVLTAESQFSTAGAAGYKTFAYLGGGTLFKDGTYGNPNHILQVVGAGTISVAAGVVTGSGTAFTADMVGQTIYSPTMSSGEFITGFIDAQHLNCGGAFTVTGEAYSIGGPIDVSGIAGLTGASGVGPDDFDTGFIQDWYIDTVPAPAPGPTAPGALPLTGVGNAGMFRTTFIQPDTDRVVFVNGYDLNKLFWARNGTPYFMGLPIPPAPKCSLEAGTSPGNTGVFNYRVRWVNATRNVISLPSDLVATVQDGGDAAHLWRITQPAVPANWVITHWIIERTTQSGGVYYPLNVDVDNPHGSALATLFFDDVVADDDAFTQRIVYSTNQAQARPFVFGCANQGRLFLGGAITMQLSGVAITDGTKDVSGLAGMTEQMIGWPISFGYSAQNTLKDGDVNRYIIAAVPSATTCTLDRNIDKSTIVYGPGGSTPALLYAFIGDIQNRASWSELDCPEYFGTPNYLGNSNEIFIGDSEALTGVIGLGSISGTNLVLWTKKTQCFLHTYGPDPSFTVGGKVVQLPVRRGALNNRCLCYANGVVYGMDQYGLWAYSPGQIPQEIGSSVRGLWQTEGLDFAYSDFFWVQHRPEDRTIVFFVVEAGQTRARLGLVYDADSGKFYAERFQAGRTCGYAAPDKDGLVRAHTYNETVAAHAWSAAWCHGIGKSDGVKWSDNSTPNAVVTALNATTRTLSFVGTTWGTNLLRGASVTLRRAGVKVSSTVIVSNDSTDIITAVDMTAMAGDIAEVGGIEWRVRTGRSDGDAPERKKKLRSATIKMREKVTSPVLSLDLGVYLDGKAAAETDRAAYSENGITQAAAGATVKVTPAGKQRYPVPLNGAECTDFQLELSGGGAGAPVELLAPVRVIVEGDEARVARR